MLVVGRMFSMARIFSGLASIPQSGLPELGVQHHLVCAEALKNAIQVLEEQIALVRFYNNVIYIYLHGFADVGFQSYMCSSYNSR